MFIYHNFSTHILICHMKWPTKVISLPLSTVLTQTAKNVLKRHVTVANIIYNMYNI